MFNAHASVSRSIEFVARAIGANRRRKNRVTPLRGKPFRRASIESLEERRMLTLTVPAYSSLPGAPHTLYLNFGGAAAFDWASNGTPYHVHGPGGSNNPVPPFDWDGNTSNFSSVELTDIKQYWSFVAEKFSPFDINVTTVNPGNLNDNQTEEVIIGGSPLDWFQPGNPSPNSGISDIGGFTDSGSNIEFMFANYFQNNLYFDATNTAHEAGHGFGLVHEQYSQTPPPKNNANYPQYYPGDGIEAPIMGGAGLSPAARGIWWETNIYPGQNSPQTPIEDELSVLFPELGTHPIPSGPINMTPDALGNVSGYGGVIVNSTTQLDRYEFTAINTSASFTINNAPYGGMLAHRADHDHRRPGCCQQSDDHEHELQHRHDQPDTGANLFPEGEQLRRVRKYRPIRHHGIGFDSLCVYE